MATNLKKGASPTPPGRVAITKLKCVCCGETKTPSDFYRSPGSRLWKQTDGRPTFCRDCIGNLYREYADRYGERTGLVLLCAMLDLPYVYDVYMTLISNNSKFEIGMYVRKMSGSEYNSKSFANSIVNQDIYNDGTPEQSDMAEDTPWTEQELSNKNTVLDVVGYDPFYGYRESDRKFLFSDLIRYFDDDISDDVYKLSQIIQIVNNNNQIRQLDLTVAQMNAVSDVADIAKIQSLKTSLIDANNKIAKENAISVKNRSEQSAGKSTLTYLLKDLREKDIPGSEENYYDQLTGDGTQWAANMSMKSIIANTFMDENDKQRILETQRELISTLQRQVDDLKEENRLLKIAQKNEGVSE